MPSRLNKGALAGDGQGFKRRPMRPQHPELVWDSLDAGATRGRNAAALWGHASQTPASGGCSATTLRGGRACERVGRLLP
jgi:hypothetical protein